MDFSGQFDSECSKPGRCNVFKLCQEIEKGVHFWGYFNPEAGLLEIACVKTRIVKEFEFLSRNDQKCSISRHICSAAGPRSSKVKIDAKSHIRRPPKSQF